MKIQTKINALRKQYRRAVEQARWQKTETLQAQLGYLLLMQRCGHVEMTPTMQERLNLLQAYGETVGRELGDSGH